MSKAMRKSSKQNIKTLHKISLKRKSRKWAYIQKFQKTFRKNKEKFQAKLLFEPIRKAQRQCKTKMAGLERNQWKSSKEKSVFTDYT